MSNSGATESETSSDWLKAFYRRRASWLDDIWEDWKVRADEFQELPFHLIHALMLVGFGTLLTVGMTARGAPVDETMGTSLSFGLIVLAGPVIMVVALWLSFWRGLSARVPVSRVFLDVVFSAVLVFTVTYLMLAIVDITAPGVGDPGAWVVGFLLVLTTSFGLVMWALVAGLGLRLGIKMLVGAWRLPGKSGREDIDTPDTE